MKEATPTNYTWSLAKELATYSTQGHLPGVRSFRSKRVGRKGGLEIERARTNGVAQHDGVARARCVLVIVGARAREQIHVVLIHRHQAPLRLCSVYTSL